MFFFSFGELRCKDSVLGSSDNKEQQWAFLAHVTENILLVENVKTSLRWHRRCLFSAQYLIKMRILNSWLGLFPDGSKVILRRHQLLLFNNSQDALIWLERAWYRPSLHNRYLATYVGCQDVQNLTTCCITTVFLVVKCFALTVCWIIGHISFSILRNIVSF